MFTYRTLNNYKKDLNTAISELGEVFNSIDDFTSNNFYSGITYSNYTKLEKTEVGYELEILAPGLNLSDFSVTVNVSDLENILEIISNVKNKWVSKIQKRIKLPSDANEHEITASIKNGILSINIPKKEKNDSDKIIKVV